MALSRDFSLEMESNLSPSIFSLTGCDKLKSSLRDAFRYLVDYMRNNYGAEWIPPSDETVLILDLLLEYNYLKSYSSSYSEHLFQLVRLSSNSRKKIEKIWPSLVCLAVLPYLKRKADCYFQELNYKEPRTSKEAHKIRVYQTLTKSASFLNLLLMIRYSVGRSPYHNLTNALFGLTYEHRVDEAIDSKNLSLSAKTSRVLADSLGRLLTIGSYVIQFLDYWNTHSNSAPLFTASLPIPDPPSTEDLPYTDEKSTNLCLICLHVRQNECVLSNTGYVFCYSCLLRYVTTKRKCPVTGYPANEDNIVRLFTEAPS